MYFIYNAEKTLPVVKFNRIIGLIMLYFVIGYYNPSMVGDLTSNNVALIVTIGYTVALVVGFCLELLSRYEIKRTMEGKLYYNDMGIKFLEVKFNSRGLEYLDMVSAFVMMGNFVLLCALWCNYLTEFYMSTVIILYVMELIVKTFIGYRVGWNITKTCDIKVP